MDDRPTAAQPGALDMPEPLDPLESRLPEEVFQRFTNRLVALARSRLDQRLAAKVDAEDIVQSVYKSFFWRAREGQFDLASWNNLWGLLVRITVCKCLKQQELYFAGRRQVSREVQPPDASGSDIACSAYDREPGPADAAMLVETIEQLMAGLDEQQQQMLTLRLQGCTVLEISQQTSRSERTIERVLQRVRHRMERLEATDES